MLPLVEMFCVHLESEGRSPKTIEWYRASLGKFAAWLGSSDHPQNPEDWTANTLRAYVVALRRMPKPDGLPLSATSVATYTRSLRAFCRWLEVEEFASANPMAKVKAPTAPKLVKPVLSNDEARAVLLAAKAGRNGLRDEALMLFLLDTGARAGEVCGLREADIEWGQRLAKLYGKGAKERYVPFSAPTMKAMQRYALRARADGPAFFLSEEGGKLSPSGLLQLCHRIGGRAGTELNPHKLRHTFAISYLRAGASVFALQKTLGHSSLDMSLRYASLMTDDLVASHKAYSPVVALTGRGGR